MEIILNKIAIWGASGSTELNKRLSPIGSRYLEEGNPVYKISDKPLIRYCKDYAHGELEFCLFVRTDKEDDKKIEKTLDALAKSLTKEEILEYLAECQDMSFVYTNKMIGE